nr:MAG TPA: hypothetical protein [Caudoviricetes sp.]
MLFLKVVDIRLSTYIIPYFLSEQAKKTASKRQRSSVIKF